MAIRQRDPPSLGGSDRVAHDDDDDDDDDDACSQ